MVEARASLGEAQAVADIARSRLERARVLAERGVTTMATLDDLEAASVQAAQALARAEATLARWDTGSIDSQPDVDVAQAALDAARIDLERAVRDLAKGRGAPRPLRASSSISRPASASVRDLRGL